MSKSNIFLFLNSGRTIIIIDIKPARSNFLLLVEQIIEEW